MTIALAASPADFKQFEWMYNAGRAFKLRLDDTPVTVEPDDLIGFRKATRGPTAGAYQVVLAKYPQKIYRSIKQDAIDKFIKQLKEYTGVPEAPSKNGARHTYMRKNQLKNDRQESQFYVSPRKPKELDHYDRDDYQWRDVMHVTNVTTKHYGTTRSSLKPGDVIGLRYLRKSHGGYIIMPSGERVLIAHDLYEQITNNTDILPRAKQLTGLVDYSELEQTLPKRPAARRIKIPVKRKHETENGERPRLTGESESAKHAARNAPLVTMFKYEDIEEQVDFEEEEEDEILNPPDPDEDFIEEDTVNTGEQPSITDLEDEDFDEEEDPEMDFHKDDEVDEDGETVEDNTSVLAEEGLTLISRDNSEWVIVSVEEHGMSDSLVLYNADTNALRHYKVHAGEDLRNVKSVTVGKKLEGPALDKILEKAADLEMTPGKRL